MGLLTFSNGFSIDPQTYEYQRYDLDREDGTGRDQNGDMYRDRAGTKVKLECTFPPLHNSEISKILQAVSSTFFTLTYMDAYYGGNRTMTCYIGDRTAPLYIYDVYKKEWLWQGLSMNFIEK